MIESNTLEYKSRVVNSVASAAIEVIVKGMLEQGMDTKDVIICLESVAAGVVMSIAKKGYVRSVWDKVAEGVKLRFDQQEFKDSPVKGNA